MAIEKDYSFRQVPVKGAYHKITQLVLYYEKVSVNTGTVEAPVYEMQEKLFAAITLAIMANADAEPLQVLGNFKRFNPNLDGENFLAQAYDYLKTTEDYNAGTKDV